MTIDELSQLYATADRTERQARKAVHLCEDLRMDLRTENMKDIRKRCAPTICAAIFQLEDAAWRLRRMRKFLDLIRDREEQNHGEERHV